MFPTLTPTCAQYLLLPPYCQEGIARIAEVREDVARALSAPIRMDWSVSLVSLFP